MNRAELISAYKERNAKRLKEPPIPAELRGLGDAWFISKAVGEVEGLDIYSLRGRWRVLEGLIGQGRYSERGYFLYALASGMHLKEVDTPEFEHIKQISEQVPQILGHEAGKFLHIEDAGFTTGAKVLVAGFKDLARPDILYQLEDRNTLGESIYRAYKDDATFTAMVRIRHVIAGLDMWLDRQKPIRTE